MTDRISPGDADILLVVDVQNDFCSGGALAVPGGDEIIPIINKIAGHFTHVLLTQDWHPLGHHSFASVHPGRRPYETIRVPYGEQVLWPDHCVQGSRGAELHQALSLRHAELVLRKGYRQEVDSYSAFFENDHATPTGLSGYLRERGFIRVFLAGMAFDYCVLWSAEDARRLGFEAVILEDACRSIDIEGSVAARFQASGGRRALRDIGSARMTGIPGLGASQTRPFRTPSQLSWFQRPGHRRKSRLI
jgi:nicotinamidase/pyrazinamidase